MFIPVEETSPSFTGFTLIMPAVSVGNVGQLAVDLLISSLNLQKVGYFHSDSLIPVVGNNPYSSNTSGQDSHQLCTSAEVYWHSDLKLAVLQIRSLILQTKIRSFRKAVMSWIKSSCFSRMVLLSSSHAYHRDDQQLRGSPLRYLLTEALREKVEVELQQLGWRELERVSSFPGVTEVEQQRLCIPGGGVTKSLYNDCCTENISMAVLLLFCSEGDNVPDAFTLVNHLNEWLHLLDKPAQGPTPWMVPLSWRLLFGNGLPPMIF